MPPAARSEVDSQSPATPHDRPWLFAFLITPDAVISLGLVSGALTYLLRDQGVNPARAASIASLLSLPHAIYFLWGPLTDFWMRRRTWLLLAAAASAIALVAAFHQSQLATPWAVGLLFLSACFGVFVVAACGGILGTLQERAEPPPRQQLLPDRLAGLRRCRCFCAGHLFRPRVSRFAGLDRCRHDRVALARRLRRARAVHDPRAWRAPNRRAHLA